jgi:hypothetical protein
MGLQFEGVAMAHPAGSPNLIAETELKKLFNASALGAHATLPVIEWPQIPPPPNLPAQRHIVSGVTAVADNLQRPKRT